MIMCCLVMDLCFCVVAGDPSVHWPSHGAKDESPAIQSTEYAQRGATYE